MTDEERLIAEFEKTLAEVTVIVDQIAILLDGRMVPVACAALALTLESLMEQHKHPDVGLAKHLHAFVTMTTNGVSLGVIKRNARNN